MHYCRLHCIVSTAGWLVGSSQSKPPHAETLLPCMSGNNGAAGCTVSICCCSGTRLAVVVRGSLWHSRSWTAVRRMPATLSGSTMRCGAAAVCLTLPVAQQAHPVVLCYKTTHGTGTKSCCFPLTIFSPLPQLLHSCGQSLKPDVAMVLLITLVAVCMCVWQATITASKGSTTHS